MIRVTLKEIPLFKSLSDSELEIVKKRLKKVSYSAGDTIIEEGETGPTMYIFERGRVKITRNLTLKIGERWGAAERAMDVLDANQVGFFGEMSLLTGAPRSATITAITDCVFYTLDAKDLEELKEAHPEIAYKILREIAVVLANRVRKLNDTVLKLTTALSLVLSKR